MSPLIRSNATHYERFLIVVALGLGGLGLFGGLSLVFTGLIISLNPAANPTGRMGLVLTVYAVSYLVPGLVLVRKRSNTAWAALMVVFVAHAVLGTIFVSAGALVPAGVGLYAGYRTAKDGTYDVPFVNSRPS